MSGIIHERMKIVWRLAAIRDKLISGSLTYAEEARLREEKRKLLEYERGLAGKKYVLGTNGRKKEDAMEAKSYHKKRTSYMEEGCVCQKAGCMGRYVVEQDTCYCLACGHPPCGSCENAWLECDTCGFKPEELADEQMEKKMTLYKIKDTEIYGQQLAVGSDGLALFEERGTLTLHKVKPSDIEEVIPYSVGISFNEDSQVYHYWTKEGEVAVGDLIFINGSFARVKKIDTKSSRANKWLTGHKFVTKPIEGGDEEVVD